VGAGHYFEDFTVGERIVTRGVTLTEASIVDFGQQFDPQPFHVDATAAAESPYGGLIASGFHTAALCFRLFVDQGRLADCSLGSPGIEQLRWLAPVRPGDTLHAEVEVAAARRSGSRPDRGLVTLDYRTENQHGDTVLTMRIVHLLGCRPDAVA
jgi:acyl dehydratase